MPKYRKKPVVIKAFRMGIDPMPDWFSNQVSNDKIILHNAIANAKNWDGKPWCEIHTLEGIMKADYGDYVIQGVQGEIYPCKPDIFEKTYDPAE